MACNASKTPLLRSIAKRGFAAQACPAAVAEIKNTTLPNKLVVASASSNLPITRVSVVFRAGSRNETYDSLGAAHILSNSAGLSTHNASAFGIIRNIQQVGGNLTSSVDRELVTYTVETTSDKIETALKQLQNAVTNPAFKPWEISDSVPRIRNQLADVSGAERAIDLVHKAAFRGSLGNSVYCPKHQIGKVSTETLLHYYANTCTTNRCAVVGVGIDQNILSGFAQSLELQSGAGKDNPATYYGGDMRKDKSGSLAHVAVAGEGGSLCSPKEALAFAILQQALGAGASAKRGNVNGAIGRAIASAVGDSSASYSTLNASYADSGLFGFVISVDGRKAGKAVEAAAKSLRSGCVSETDFNRGKALLKAITLSNSDSSSGLLKSLGSQAALLGDVISTDDMIAAIDAVSKADVDAAASKVARSKVSVGAVGNLGHVQYASDLSF